jgi:predicted RNA-binding Zn-ribbon protein involved in translation (DUF1610 family)
MTCEGSPERYACPDCPWEGSGPEVAWKGRWASTHEGELTCPKCGHSGLIQTVYESDFDGPAQKGSPANEGP